MNGKIRKCVYEEMPMRRGAEREVDTRRSCKMRSTWHYFFTCSSSVFTWGHLHTFMCCHPQARPYRSNPQHKYLKCEVVTPYHRYSFQKATRFIGQLQIQTCFKHLWHTPSLKIDPKNLIFYPFLHIYQILWPLSWSACQCHQCENTNFP